MRWFLLSIIPVASAFAPCSTIACRRNSALFSYPPQDEYYGQEEENYYPEEEQEQYYPEQQQEQELYLGDDVEEQMHSLKSKFPTSEADYLAAARQRAAEARASINSGASDHDWQEMASTQEQQGDGWENALMEEGNEESQILIPKGMEGDGEDTGEDEEPKLLLF